MKKKKWVRTGKWKKLALTMIVGKPRRVKTYTEASCLYNAFRNLGFKSKIKKEKGRINVYRMK